MKVEELATKAMAYAADLLDTNSSDTPTDLRLKVLYQAAKILEICKTRESIVQQFHITSLDQPGVGGAS